MKKKYLVGLTLFVLYLLSSCNELDKNEPVDLTRVVIPQNSELFQLLDDVVNASGNSIEDRVCVNFIYPFRLYKYNQENLPEGNVVLYSDAQFSSFLSTLPPTISISISYPIEVSFPDGTVISINNNDELLIALNSCTPEQIIGYCNGISTTKNNSVWMVPYLEGIDNTLAGATLTIDALGTITMNHLGETYNGARSILYVNGVLHINIFIEGNSSVADFWNHNYRVVTMTPDFMEFSYNGSPRFLELHSETEIEYSIGDTGPGGGIVVFDKTYFSDGWRYLEMLTTDVPLIEEWGCLSTSVENAQRTVLGSGYQNTIAIGNKHDSLTGYYIMPATCNSLNNGSVCAKSALGFDQIYHDWFIPSADEFQSLYDTLLPTGLLNFGTDKYWTSSEGTMTQAKCFNFSTGEIQLVDKNASDVKTRYIRMF